MLTTLASAATLDGYNTGLSAAEDVPGSVEPRLSPELAQRAEFLPLELEAVDGATLAWGGGRAGGRGPRSGGIGWRPRAALLAAEGRFNEFLGMAARDLLHEGVQRLVEDANRLEPYFLGLAGGQE